MPFDGMSSVPQVSVFDQIAIGKQDRIAGLVGGDPHPVTGQDIGAILEIGDPAKTFRLALGAEDAVGDIEPRQGRVGFGIDACSDLNPGIGSWLENEQVLTVELVPGAIQLLSVHGN